MIFKDLLKITIIVVIYWTSSVQSYYGLSRKQNHFKYFLKGRNLVQGIRNLQNVKELKKWSQFWCSSSSFRGIKKLLAGYKNTFNMWTQARSQRLLVFLSHTLENCWLILLENLLMAGGRAILWLLSCFLRLMQVPFFGEIQLGSLLAEVL